MRRFQAVVLIATLAASSAVFTARMALAQDGSFYRGKTITVVVGYSAGGGYDIYARTLARHLGLYVPGNPSIVVQNMPGAASFVAARHIATTAPRDGTVMAMFDPGLILESLAVPEKISARFSDYQWIGSMSRDVSVCYAWGATGIKTWDDMMKRKEFIIGLTAKGSATYVNGATIRKVFNAPVRHVAGYPGSMEQRLAIERGELDGNCASWSALPQDWIVNNKINVLVRFSRKRPDDMPAFAPFVNELATSEEQRALLDILNGPIDLGRPLIVAKEVPRERVEILRSAFDAAVTDNALLADAQRQSLPIDLLSGREAEAIVGHMYAATPALVRRIKDVIE
jgi:tripartite-type tricarboxylate transporter receptor subunit TctC